MPFGLIDELKRRGEMVLWHRYDKKTFHDFSGQGNEPTTISGAKFEGGGLRFTPDNGYILVPDALSLRMGYEMTIVVTHEYKSLDRTGAGSGARLVSKRDAGSNDYEWIASDTVGEERLYFYNGGTVSDQPAPYVGARSNAISVFDGDYPEIYIDGISVGEGDATITLAENDAPLYIGNYYLLGRSTYATLFNVMIVNRSVTQSEMAQLHGELMKLRD